MKSKHIAFCVEQAYGHIMPTLGIALELTARGHRVSYAVNDKFAQLIRQIRATPIVIEPLETRSKVLEEILDKRDSINYKFGIAEITTVLNRLLPLRTAHSLNQLEQLYREDRPDLVIHDDNLDTAGRELANKWSIAKIRHHSQFLDAVPLTLFSDDELIIVTVPAFFQRDLPPDQRFKFVGFIPEGRKQASSPWQPPSGVGKPILMSPTTGLMPQLDFCNLMLEACKGQEWTGVLSLSGGLDKLSAIDLSQFADLPPNVHLNSAASNFDIMDHSRLFIGQGGQGSTLEAIYCRVPQIVAPPTPFHYSVAKRTAELGLGYCLPMSELSTEGLVHHISAILDDEHILANVEKAGSAMRENRGAQLAVDIIDGFLN